MSDCFVLYLLLICMKKKKSGAGKFTNNSMEREAFFHKNIYFYKDENGNPIWKDTYVYATLNE